MVCPDYNVHATLCQENNNGENFMDLSTTNDLLDDFVTSLISDVLVPYPVDPKDSGMCICSLASES